jgi:valyl-tRNA synthetase
MVGMKGFVTAEQERKRIERELKRIEKDLQAIDKKLSSKNFVERAPAEVITETNQQRASLLEARARLEESRALADELDA